MSDLVVIILEKSEGKKGQKSDHSPLRLVGIDYNTRMARRGQNILQNLTIKIETTTREVVLVSHSKFEADSALETFTDFKFSRNQSGRLKTMADTVTEKTDRIQHGQWS